ncbi:MAG: TatD family hydrolase [bacterium]
MFIDSHCHLNFQKFNDDYKDAIKNAQDASVGKILNIGSNLETSERSIQIAKEFPDVCFVSVGIHPIHVLDENFDQKFEKLACEKQVVAIGETGLDYYRMGKVELQAKSRTDSPTDETGARDKQKKLFLKHLELAKKLNKPMILHCRDAYSDLLQILKEFDKDKKLKKVLHCYDGNTKYLQEFLNIKCLISFTGNVTYGDKQDQAISQIPIDLLMIETDAPYLTPNPYRGQKNQPAYVIEVAKHIAKIKKIELEKLEEVLQKTTEDFFGI